MHSSLWMNSCSLPLGQIPHSTTSVTLAALKFIISTHKQPLQIFLEITSHSSPWAFPHWSYHASAAWEVPLEVLCSDLSVTPAGKLPTPDEVSYGFVQSTLWGSQVFQKSLRLHDLWSFHCHSVQSFPDLNFSYLPLKCLAPLIISRWDLNGPLLASFKTPISEATFQKFCCFSQCLLHQISDSTSQVKTWKGGPHKHV